MSSNIVLFKLNKKRLYRLINNLNNTIGCFVIIFLVLFASQQNRLPDDFSSNRDVVNEQSQQPNLILGYDFDIDDDEQFPGSFFSYFRNSEKEPALTNDFRSPSSFSNLYCDNSNLIENIALPPPTSVSR